MTKILDKILLRRRQEAIRAQKIAQRNALQSEKALYEAANASIKDIISNIVQCEANLGETYEKISAGIICNDVGFTTGTANIKKYQNQLNIDRDALQQISGEINTEIQELSKKIDRLNSEIY